jgi:carboxylesterase type B
MPWDAFFKGDGNPADMDIDTGSSARPPLFRPVIDGWVLPHGYDETYEKGLQNQVTYIAGNNLDESGAVPPETFQKYRDDAADPNAPWHPGMPPTHVTLKDFRESAEQKFGDLAEEYLALYPATNDEEASLASNESVGDNARISTYLWGRDWTKHVSLPVRTYFWTYRALVGKDKPRRAAHASEIIYAFDNLDVEDRGWNATDHEVSDTISTYWTNFIKTGDPNGEGLVEWPLYDSDVPRVMEIGQHCGSMEVASEKKINFWYRFFQTQRAW